jgi:hypothetical protein
MWDEKQKKYDRIKQKGFVWYIKQPHKMIFLKELDLPTKKVLDDEQAIAIARAFITENRFATVTGIDLLKSTGVLVLKKQEIRLDGKIGKILILAQRVSFMRLIDGLPVLNAKQTVDLHLDSEEIIGYKKIRWAEIFPRGDSLPYRSRYEIVSEIRTQLTKPGADYTIEKVIPAMYQTSDKIVPVGAVHTLKRVRNDKVRPIQEVFLVGLVKELNRGRASQPARENRPPSAVVEP